MLWNHNSSVRVEDEIQEGTGRDEGGVVRVARKTGGSHGKMSDQKAGQGQYFQKCFLLCCFADQNGICSN